MKKVIVMVVNDGDIIQPKIRSFLSDYVFKEKNYVMHEACNFKQAVDNVKTLNPDMIMIDGGSFATEGYKRGDTIVADMVSQSRKSIIIMFNSNGELAEKAIQNGAHMTIDNMKEKEGQQIKNLMSLLIK
jgi:chemotaxis response regulator CheB